MDPDQFADGRSLISRLGVNYFENVINYLQLHWKLFN